jgi:hypothetical protein
VVVLSAERLCGAMDVVNARCRAYGSQRSGEFLASELEGKGVPVGELRLIFDGTARADITVPAGLLGVLVALQAAEGDQEPSRPLTVDDLCDMALDDLAVNEELEGSPAIPRWAAWLTAADVDGEWTVDVLRAARLEGDEAVLWAGWLLVGMKTGARLARLRRWGE